MNRGIFLLSIAAALISMACASSTKLYPGDRRAPEQVAEIKMATNGTILEINGRTLSGNGYELLPGTYDLTFSVIVRQAEVFPGHEDVGVRDTLVCMTRVRLEAGRRYKISRRRVRVPLVDRGQRQEAGGGRKGALSIPIYLNTTDLDDEPIAADLVDCRGFMSDDDYMKQKRG